MNKWRRYAKRAVNMVMVTAVLAGFLSFVGVQRASARDRDDYRGRCQQRIERAEFQLDKAIRQHGLRSRQAENKRRKLREERQRCWNNGHSWWDGRGRTWRNDRDWDRD